MNLEWGNADIQSVMATFCRQPGVPGDTGSGPPATAAWEVLEALDTIPQSSASLHYSFHFSGFSLDCLLSFFQVVFVALSEVE